MLTVIELTFVTSEGKPLQFKERDKTRIRRRLRTKKITLTIKKICLQLQSLLFENDRSVILNEFSLRGSAPVNDTPGFFMFARSRS